jgi:16S rRNA C967 or C1407 C5-methylase (RsmB/RsmF family)
MGRRKGPSQASAVRRDPELPAELRTTLADLIGDEVAQLENALRMAPPTSIRIDPLKGFDPGGASVPWCSTGRYLEERPAFTFDPLFHAGTYYVQEASSMFLEQALLAAGLLKDDILAIDLCAAPGGKSTHLRSLLTPGSLLVANEIDRQRLPALQENLWKWGGPNVVITGSPTRDLNALPDHFDLILVDAPCSGEGMFRKDPFAREQWTPDLVQQCAAMQQSIVHDAWHALAPGGVLIYSTCTWEPAENELQLVPLLEQGADNDPDPVEG